MNKPSQVEKFETSKTAATPASVKSAAAVSSPQSSPTAPRHADWWRETIESIVVALILAFLFRTFEAEAFVIPTGSMAPTLLGRHKDVHCPECGYQFTVGASEEVDNYGYLVENNRIRSALCPNCRYPVKQDDVFHAPVFTGDRILVNKFPYEFAEPKRWDVLVFKYPEEPKTNYIKRLIGLPGEKIEIRQGDVYLHTDEGPRIVWKDDPVKLREVQILVYDNDRPETSLHAKGWPERWAAVKKGPGGTAGWADDAEGWKSGKQRSFSIGHDTSLKLDNELHWLRYRHFVPNDDDWRDLAGNRSLRTPQPQLIVDFCGYNAASNDNDVGGDAGGIYWVGDLMLDCQVDVDSATPGAQIVFELNEGARRYRCRIEPESGKATLYYPDPLNRDDDASAEVVLAEAETRMKGTGSYHITFANEDNRLSLWVDGRAIDFGEKAAYEPHGGLPFQAPTDADLVPVGIAARGVAARVSHLVLHRDIYYRCDFWHPGNHNARDDFGGMSVSEYIGHWPELARNLSRPKAWFDEYQRGLAVNKTGPGEEYEGVHFVFPLADDEYFVMGDNSPRSKDSRLWSNARNATHRHAVPRSSLVGKAFFVYWPHGVPFLNDGKGLPDGANRLFEKEPLAQFFYHRLPPDRDNPRGKVARPLYPSRRIPFYPNVPRMERIR